jgi:hypothetical protein
MRQLPTDEQVLAAMNEVLATSGETGKRPTVTTVEQRLGVTHATFYRTYPELITWFKEQTAERRRARQAATPSPNGAEETMTRLRRENEDLRRLAKIYAEAIRQLTVDNVALRAAVNSDAGVSDLAAHRARRQAEEPDP